MALILVIDDSRTVHVALKLAFRKDGHDVIGLHTIADLASTLDVDRPDVIVLDLLMPGFNGIELARLIEQYSAVPPPIILHSGSDPDVVKIVAREIRPFAIVPKGDSEAQLRSAVAQALVAERRAAVSRPTRPWRTRPRGSGSS